MTQDQAMTQDMPNPASTPTGDPWLLTPGPLTTAPAVKRAMVHDYGSRDARFIDINRRIRDGLVEIIGGGGAFTCVPLQGSGTFAVEAMIGTLVPRDGCLLVPVNGAYGARMAKICERIGRRCVTLETAEDVPNDPAAVDALLSKDPSVTHVAVVHCETTSGILNPVAEVAEAVARHGRGLLVDAMSAFGAIALDAASVPFDAVAASSNKCLEGVPGMGFVLVRESVLSGAGGNAPSLSLDLHDQWVAMEKNGQWRFTPPVQVLVAFDEALRAFREQGGVAARGGRYGENCRALIGGMRALGFAPLLPEALQAPIIVTFHMPADRNFGFQEFYDRLSDRGYVIYPGKLTVAETFRIGCIGALGVAEIRGALVAIEQTLSDMGVRHGAPATAAARYSSEG